MIKTLFLFFFIALSNGCMMMGLKTHGTMTESSGRALPKIVQKTNKGEMFNKMIKKAVLDLSKKELDISSVAVWRIKTQSAGLDVELVRQKLISELVNLNHFKVISRQRLSELLEEQSLALSGSIDEKNAVEIGGLIGVEGFIDGYVQFEDNRLTLSLKLVETRSGIITWAKTIEMPDVF